MPNGNGVRQAPIVTTKKECAKLLAGVERATVKKLDPTKQLGTCQYNMVRYNYKLQRVYL